MSRKFLSNLGFLIFVNLIIKPLYIFGIDITIQNTLGEDIYGAFFSIYKYALIFSIVLDFGIENFNRREIARNATVLNRYFSNFITLKLLLGGIYFITAIIGGLISDYSFFQLKLLFLLLFNEMLRSMIMYLRANLGGLHKFKIDSVFSVLDRGLLIIICGFLLLNPGLKAHFKIEWFVLSQTAAYSVSCILAFFFVGKHISHFTLGIKRSYSLTIIRQLLPYALLLFLMAIYTHIDPYLIERLLPDGNHQAGIYAQSSRLLEACANYSYLFAVILLPLFSRMIKKGEDFRRLLRLSYMLIIIPSIFIVVGSNIFKNEITGLLYPNSGIESAKVFGTLMFSLLGLSTTYIYGTLLTANGNLKILNLVAAAGVFVSILLNLLLIPKLKSYGGSIANISSQLITALAQIVIVHLIFKIKINYKNILLLAFYFTVLFVAGGIIYHKAILYNWFIKYLIFTGFGIVLTIGLTYKDIKQFLSFIRQEK